MATISIEPGFRLGKYEVMEHLATGGMGAVYKAIDRELGRLVALKVLSADRFENAQAIQRFRREARHAARLNHPNIVMLYDFGQDRQHNLLFLALEFIHGVDLATHIAARGRLEPEEARRILIQVVRSLAHAFEHGIVHRDIKPSNIMLARLGGKVCVKLTDLGLAIANGENEFRVTREGCTVGTIDYMAPEQARDSRTVDTRSDIYSLGCTAYHMLAGKAPFAEGGLGERLFKHLEAPPPDVRQFNSTVSAGFWAIIEKMLAKEPADRYADPGQLLRALKRTDAVAAEPDHDVLPVPCAQRRTKHHSSAPTRLVTAKPPAAEASAHQSSQPNAPAEPVSSEQARAAVSYFEHAMQALAQEGSDDYARQLLDACLKMDPFHLAGRKALRALNQKTSPGVMERWFGSLTVLAIKSRMRLARSTGDWRNILHQGEHLLAYQPGDADTHLSLAETATDLGQPDLARWFLEQGCHQAPANAALLRALARHHERLEQWKPAIKVWEQVVALEPANREAQRKISALSVQDLLTGGHYSK